MPDTADQSDRMDFGSNLGCGVPSEFKGRQTQFKIDTGDEIEINKLSQAVKPLETFLFSGAFNLQLYIIISRKEIISTFLSALMAKYFAWPSIVNAV